MGEYRMEEFQKEACQRVVCQPGEFQREEMGARWWHRHASRSQRHRSQSGGFRMGACRKEEPLRGVLQTEVPRKVVGRPGLCRTEENRREACLKGVCQREEMVARW